MKTCKHCGQEDPTILAPCHFCGGLTVELEYHDLSRTYSVNCYECGASFHLIGSRGKKRDATVNIWNGAAKEEKL